MRSSAVMQCPVFEAWQLCCPGMPVVRLLWLLAFGLGPHDASDCIRFVGHCMLGPHSINKEIRHKRYFSHSCRMAGRHSACQPCCHTCRGQEIQQHISHLPSGVDQWPLHQELQHWLDPRVAQLVKQGIVSSAEQRPAAQELAKALCNAWKQSGGPSVICDRIAAALSLPEHAVWACVEEDYRQRVAQTRACSRRHSDHASGHKTVAQSAL